MKLSEAIRQGSVGKTQCQEDYFTGDNCCCVLGAAMIAACDPDKVAEVKTHYRANFLGRKLLAEIWPVLEQPFDSDDDAELHSIIISMNDRRGMNFEEIAAWLEARGL